MKTGTHWEERKAADSEAKAVRATKTSARDAAITRMHNDALNPAEIAAALNCDRKTVVRTLARLGLTS